MNEGVLTTPALVIDGVVKLTGKVPKAEETNGWISKPLLEYVM